MRYSRINGVPTILVLTMMSSASLTMLFLYMAPNLSLDSMSIPLPHFVFKHKMTYGDYLGIADQIYVVSLPKRRDRREDMEVLRRALNLDWSYESALPSESPLVPAILDWVSSVREDISIEMASPSGFNFAWPEDIDDIVNSTKEIPLLFPVERHPLEREVQSISESFRPLPCATHDYTIPDNTTRVLPNYLVLDPPKIACWHSHVSVISQIANFRPGEGHEVGLILEDDVDMEEDIRQQLVTLWPHLPTGWDMVFLGHCWSNETEGAALTPRLGGPSSSRLYVSKHPQCTHAYALSRQGARRLLLYLQYPPFAYSRAIDQAFAHLISRHHLRSVSVVPSLVIQRKISKSDILQGANVGSGWRESLAHGVLDNIGLKNASAR